jgi:hypothetical protein
MQPTANQPHCFQGVQVDRRVRPPVSEGFDAMGQCIHASSSCDRGRHAQCQIWVDHGQVGQQMNALHSELVARKRIGDECAGSSFAACARSGGWGASGLSSCLVSHLTATTASAYAIASIEIPDQSHAYEQPPRLAIEPTSALVGSPDVLMIQEFLRSGNKIPARLPL